MKKIFATHNARVVLLSLVSLLWSAGASADQGLGVSFLYRLSTFTGGAEVGGWPVIRTDDANGEIYVLSQDDLTVFQNGMQIYSLANESSGQVENHQIFDVAVKKNGNMILLKKPYRSGKSFFELIEANYRGEPISVLSLKGIPQELAEFTADRLLYRDGLLYLVNMSRPKVMIIDENGAYQRSYDIMAVLRKDAEADSDRGRKRRKNIRQEQSLDAEVEWELGDVSIDPKGNILFTVPVIGAARILTPDLQLLSISRRGSGPGKFGIPSGIAADRKGNYFVSDVLKCVVMIFDKNLAFVDEFGGRNSGQVSLIAPRGLVMDVKDRLYVSQAEVMGVSVFQLSYN